MQVWAGSPPAKMCTETARPAACPSETAAWIGQRIMERTVVGHELDNVRAVIDDLANSLPDFVRCVGVDVLVEPESALFW